MKQWAEIGRLFSYLTQLGLSLITPLLFCLAVCYLLTTKAGAGAWIYLPGFILGIGSGIMVARNLWKVIERDLTKKKEDRPVVRSKHEKGTSFNEHF